MPTPPYNYGLGKATSIGVAPNPFEDSEPRVPRIGARPKSKFDQLTGLDTGPNSRYQEFFDTLYENPAIQALGLIPTGGTSLAIGPFSPAQRAIRKAALIQKIMGKKMAGTMSSTTLNRVSKDIGKHPNISAYLDDTDKETTQSFNGSLASLQDRGRVAEIMGSGPRTQADIATVVRPSESERLLRMEVKPVKSGDTTTRHEYGHLARWIQNPDSAAKSARGGEYSQQYGYWLNPEEIRARAIAAKTPSEYKAGLSAYINPTTNEVNFRGYKPSYQKNDYRYRLYRSIAEGIARTGQGPKLNNFYNDVDKYFPWYDPTVVSGFKLGVPVTK
jgi:hypothetical protein